MTKKLSIRFLKFCLGVEIWGFFQARLGLGQVKLLAGACLLGHLYVESVCKISDHLLSNWGRMDGQADAHNTKIYSNCKKLITITNEFFTIIACIFQCKKCTSTSSKDCYGFMVLATEWEHRGWGSIPGLVGKIFDP